MLAVGWGEKYNGRYLKGTPFLIAKNSFGKSWGIDGYI
jgi:C1A family cysteine protease